MSQPRLAHIRFCQNAQDMTAIAHDPAVQLALMRMTFSPVSELAINDFGLQKNSGTTRLETFSYDAQTRMYTDFNPPKLFTIPSRLHFFTECATIAQCFAEATGNQHIKGVLVQHETLSTLKPRIDEESFVGYVPLRGHGFLHYYPKPVNGEKGASVPLNYLAIWTGVQGPTKTHGPSKYTLHPEGRLPTQNLYLRLTPA